MTPPIDFTTVLPDRAVIAISGDDALSFLQRVLTHGPEGVALGEAQFSALLTPQGKILSDMMIFTDSEGTLYFDVPASEQEALVKRFTMYRLRAKAEINIRSDLDVAVTRDEGEDALKMVALTYSQDPRSAELGIRAIVPAGGPSQDQDQYHAARIELGIPEFGADYGPAEIFSTDVNHDVLGAIDYKKGCFVGQEVASRMHRKGGVRKRTLCLRIDQGVSAGDEVFAHETPVGKLTSISGKSGLALLRIDRVAKALKAGETLSVNSKPVALHDPLNLMTEAETQ